MAKITKDSHVDHALTPEQVAFVVRMIAELTVFGILQLELPEELGTVPCGLHGPVTGGPRLCEEQVTYAIRGKRTTPSRMVARPPVASRKLVVIVGPHEGECILFTAYGGPLAPREPLDPSIQDSPELLAESRAFWSEHALGAE